MGKLFAWATRGRRWWRSRADRPWIRWLALRGKPICDMRSIARGLGIMPSSSPGSASISSARFDYYCCCQHLCLLEFWFWFCLACSVTWWWLQPWRSKNKSSTVAMSGSRAIILGTWHVGVSCHLGRVAPVPMTWGALPHWNPAAPISIRIVCVCLWYIYTRALLVRARHRTGSSKRFPTTLTYSISGIGVIFFHFWAAPALHDGPRA